MYNKEDAKMTQGLAILSMLCLHLFCREADDLPGKALVFINNETPLLCWIGFYSEICVPLYSFCAGYAYLLLFDQGKQQSELRCKRAMKLLENYWVVLAVFVVLGVIVQSSWIPGTLLDLLGNITLLSTKSYNGTWWFLKTYVIILFLPAAFVVSVPKKMDLFWGTVFCVALGVIRYVVFHFDILTENIMLRYPINFIYTQCLNLWHVMPYYWLGGLLYEHPVLEWLNKKLKCKNKMGKNIILLVFWTGLFIVTNIIHKAVFMTLVAVATFLIFNLLEKGSIAKKVFLFLGEHSTNIWLSHMFFISILFAEYLEMIPYASVSFLAVLLLSILTSYLVKGIIKCGSLFARG